MREARAAIPVLLSVLPVLAHRAAGALQARLIMILVRTANHAVQIKDDCLIFHEAHLETSLSHSVVCSIGKLFLNLQFLVQRVVEQKLGEKDDVPHPEEGD